MNRRAKKLLKTLHGIQSAHQHPPKATLSESKILAFLETDEDLATAIKEAATRFKILAKENPEILSLSELALNLKLRAGILNFYSLSSASPYTPLVAKGPWIISTHGGVIYDTGGYGMLGCGHNPDFLSEVLARPQAMANIMTSSLEHENLIQRLEKSIGINRENRPYSHFAFMNSGSEAVAVAARISDCHAKKILESNSEIKEIKYLAINSGFHGRTYRGAQASNSSANSYKEMASLTKNDKLVSIDINNLNQLANAFEDAQKNNIFFEMMFLEPVMGEGCAGKAVTPEFYALARKLCTLHDTLLLVDSIQAGLRCTGKLSIVDYPGFEKLAAPDFETFSKALNGGQFPMSVIALSEQAAENYVLGCYGNTMTGNPRAMNIASAVLDQHTKEISQNISKMGIYFKSCLLELKKKYPTIIEDVTGTGLLLSCKLAKHLSVVGPDNLEQKIRLEGINVIHGSDNRLRFTPWFKVTEEEINLIMHVLKNVFKAQVKFDSMAVMRDQRPSKEPRDLTWVSEKAAHNEQ